MRERNQILVVDDGETRVSDGEEAKDCPEERESHVTASVYVEVFEANVGEHNGYSGLGEEGIVEVQ